MAKEIDITKHFLVPKHEKATEEEIKQLCERLGFKSVEELKKALPKIKKDDPAIRHLDVKPGDIIKIIRKSPTAGETIYYRVVVET